MRIKNIYYKIISYESLYIAENEVHSNGRECLRYRLNLEDNLHLLHKRLEAMDFPEVIYHTFFVYEPKVRLVVCTDYETKIVQRAIYDTLAPLINRTLIKDTYSCIEGRGQKAAVERLRSWFKIQDHSDIDWDYGKFDVKKFFYRIDHEILMELLEKKVSDKKLLRLVEYYISGTGRPFGLPYGAEPLTVRPEEMLWDKGIPIGGGLSHLLGNVYLDPLDQFAKRELGIDKYIRYMDDFVIMEQALGLVKSHGVAMEQFIGERLKLRLNNKTAYRPVCCGCEFVGIRIYPEHMVHRKSTTLRMKRHLKNTAEKYHDYEISYERARDTVASYKALLKHTDNKNLSRKIWSDFALTHGDLKSLPEYDSAQYDHIIRDIKDGGIVEWV